MTAPAPLATAADLDRLGYPADLDVGLIVRASARIRAYTRQTITRVTDDVVTLPAADPLRLPQRPVVSVGKVEHLFRDDTTVELPPISYELRNNVLYGIGCRDYWPYLGLPVWVRVTYTHGYDPVLDEVIDVVGSVATRLSNQPTVGIEAGVASEAIDDYRVTYAAALLDAAADLLPGEKTTLDRILGAHRYGTVPL